jgi:hypothetical protein
MTGSAAPTVAQVIAAVAAFCEQHPDQIAALHQPEPAALNCDEASRWVARWLAEHLGVDDPDIIHSEGVGHPEEFGYDSTAHVHGFDGQHTVCQVECADGAWLLIDLTARQYVPDLAVPTIKRFDADDYAQGRCGWEPLT